MIDSVVIALTALVASAVTLFSGFGLSTVLMPVFALFFPVPVAVAATAVVHLANNLFKVVLVGRRADGRAVARFGVPAALAALAGAGLLAALADLPALASYGLGGGRREVTAVELVIGLLIVAFAALELSPRFAAFAIPSRYLPLGGLLSGFFGGLSGNQGALRSAFLVKAGLGKEAFIGTGVVCAVIVDTVRLAVYGASFRSAAAAGRPPGLAGAVATATIAAFVGAYLGARLLPKLTLRAVQLVVAISMILVGLGLASGLV